MKNLVVGNKDCSFNAIVLRMKSSPSSSQFEKTWSQLARVLGCSTSLVDELRNDIIWNKINVWDGIESILEDWRLRCSNDAKLTNLLDKLEIDCNCKAMSDHIWEAFKANIENKTVWKDLDDRFHRQVLKVQVEFFDNKLALSDLLEKFAEVEKGKILNSLNGKLIKELLTEKSTVLAHVKIPTRPDYYIDRFLSSRRRIDPKIFLVESSDIFIVQNIELAHLSEFCGNEDVDISTNQLHNVWVRFIALIFPEDFAQICENAGNSPVHLIKYNKGNFYWNKTHGSLNLVQQHICEDQDTFPESEIFQGFQNKKQKCLVCIADNPGMGKSALLANLCCLRKAQKRDRIILFIKFENLISDEKAEKTGIPNMVDKYTVLTKLAKLFSQNSLGQEIVQRMLKNCQEEVELFCDGFDEVPLGKLQLATSVLKCLSTEIPSIRIFATTRQTRREQLEDALNTISYGIIPFTEQDKINCVTRLWFHKFEIKLNETLFAFAEKLFFRIKRFLVPTEGDVTGIPLQCAMLADIYRNDAQKHANYNSCFKFEIEVDVRSIYGMYKELMRQRLEIIEDLSKRAQVKVIHQLAAFELLFPYGVIQNVLQITDSTIGCMSIGKNNKRNGFVRKIIFLIAKECGLFADIRNYDHDVIIDNVSDIEIINKLGLMTHEPNKLNDRVFPFGFLHRTYAEFFLAEFLADKLINWKSSLPSKKSNGFNFSLILLDQVLKPTVSDYDVRLVDGTDCEIRQVIGFWINSEEEDKICTNWSQFAAALNISSDDINHLDSDQRVSKIFTYLIQCWAQKNNNEPLLADVVDNLVTHGFSKYADYLKFRRYKIIFEYETLCCFLDNLLKDYEVTSSLMVSNLADDFKKDATYITALLSACTTHNFLQLFTVISNECYTPQRKKNILMEPILLNGLIDCAVLSRHFRMLKAATNFVEDLVETDICKLEKLETKQNTPPLYTHLHDACARGNIPAFIFLLRKYKNYHYDITFLLYACTIGSLRNSESIVSAKIQIIETILKNQLDFLNKQLLKETEWPVLQDQVHYRLLEYFINKFAIPVAAKNDGNTVAHDSAIYLSPDDFHKLTALLIEKGWSGSVFQRNNEDETPLHLALSQKPVKEETIELIASNTKINFNDPNILQAAIAGRQAQNILDILFKKFCGNLKKFKKQDRRLFLYTAAINGNLVAMKYFVSLGCNINDEEVGTLPLLHATIREGRRNVDQMVRFLLQNNADVNAVDEEKHTSLWYAEKEEHRVKLKPGTFELLKDALKKTSGLGRVLRILKNSNV